MYIHMSVGRYLVRLHGDLTLASAAATVHFEGGGTILGPRGAEQVGHLGSSRRARRNSNSTHLGHGQKFL